MLNWTSNFKREDYWPFMVGLYAGGLTTFPYIAGFFYPLSPPQLFGLGFFLCFIIGASFKRDLEFSWARFFGALILTVFMILRQGDLIIVIPGLGLFFLAGIYGSIGVWLGRTLGITAALVKPDPSTLHTFTTVSEDRGTTANADIDTTVSGDIDASEDFARVQDVPTNPFGDEEYQSLMDRTYEGWGSDHNPVYLDALKEWTQENGRDDLRKLFDSGKPAIEYAFVRMPLDPDEYLVEVGGSSGTSVILTNKYFYFFSRDPDVIASKSGDGRIPLGELRSCKITKGLVWHKAELRFGSEGMIEVGEIGYKGTLDYLVKICEKNAEKSGVSK